MSTTHYYREISIFLIYILITFLKITLPICQYTGFIFVHIINASFSFCVKLEAYGEEVCHLRAYINDLSLEVIFMVWDKWFAFEF